MSRKAANRTRRSGKIRCAIYTRKSSEEGLEHYRGQKGAVPIYRPPRLRLWALDENHLPYVTDDFDEYVASRERHHRVAATQIGALFVSTVFIGTAPNFGDRPLLFETMVFAPPSGTDSTDQVLEQTRYASWAEALAGHGALAAKWHAVIGAEPRVIPIPKEV